MVPHGGRIKAVWTLQEGKKLTDDLVVGKKLGAGLQVCRSLCSASSDNCCPAQSLPVPAAELPRSRPSCVRALWVLPQDFLPTW